MGLLTHKIPHIAKKRRTIIERTNYILDKFSTENTQQALTHASRICHRLCSMQVINMLNDNERGSMHNAEQLLKAVMYPAYGTR